MKIIIRFINNGIECHGQKPPVKLTIMTMTLTDAHQFGDAWMEQQSHTGTTGSNVHSLLL